MHYIQILYITGYMAGGHWEYGGGGGNYLCLHESPQWLYHRDGFQTWGGTIYGAEAENYDTADFINPFSTVNSAQDYLLGVASDPTNYAWPSTRKQPRTPGLNKD